MKLKCTGYLLIQLSCSVTGRINQSRGQLYACVFQAHLRTSGYEITVLSSQIWSTNAVPLCHSNLRWRCYYVELSKVIKTVQKKEEKSSWTFLTASIYQGCSIPFSEAKKNSTFPRSCCKMLSGHPVSVGTEWKQHYAMDFDTIFLNDGQQIWALATVSMFIFIAHDPILHFSSLCCGQA